MVESSSRKDRERNSKTKERNKEKPVDEEKDSRKERKLGRKRERLEEAPTTEHKRRREGIWFFLNSQDTFSKTANSSAKRRR